MIPYEWIEQAAERIAPHIRRTPLTHDDGRNWYFKWENRQVTGSFKARGALNKALALHPWERERGLVAASAGNHGQGLALAGQVSQAAVEVFVSRSAPAVKLDAMRALGARLHLVDGGYEAAERAGKAYAAAEEKTWVSPYNDGQIVAGQGTIGRELCAALPQLEALTVLVPVSGGGLLAGIAAALAGQGCRPRRLIGVQAARAPFMHHLFYQGTQDGLPDLDSLADGLTGAIEEPSLTTPIIRQLVDDIILVSEEAIARAVVFAWQKYGEKIEGAGAVGLAALLEGQVAAPALVVVSGGNIQPETLTALLARYGDGQG